MSFKMYYDHELHKELDLKVDLLKFRDNLLEINYRIDEEDYLKRIKLLFNNYKETIIMLDSWINLIKNSGYNSKYKLECELTNNLGTGVRLSNLYPTKFIEYKKGSQYPIPNVLYEFQYEYYFDLKYKDNRNEYL